MIWGGLGSISLFCTGRFWIDVRTILGSKIELVPLSIRKIDVFDDFWVKHRVGTFFEPENRCFRRFLGQKSSWYLFRTGKSMFSTIFGSKIELVTLSNRKIDVFDDFSRTFIQEAPFTKLLTSTSLKII